MSKFLYITFIMYILPAIITTIAFYLYDFKGHTIGEFCKYLITEVKEEDDIIPLPFILCPMANVLCGIVATIIICTKLIMFPIKILNNRYGLWKKIQKIRIK